MKNIMKKALILGLCLIMCVVLISCDSKEKPDTDNTPSVSSDENQNDPQGNQEILPPALDSQVTPINEVEAITDMETAKTIISDLTEIAELTTDSANKGISLILKHDGKLKSVPLEYPFVLWISEQTKPVIIEFVADYSEPAQKSLPYLYGIAEKYNDQAIVALVDVDKNPEIIKDFELEYLPTYYVSKDLTLYVVETSFNPEAEPSLIDKIDQVLNK